MPPFTSVLKASSAANLLASNAGVAVIPALLSCARSSTGTTGFFSSTTGGLASGLIFCFFNASCKPTSTFGYS